MSEAPRRSRALSAEIARRAIAAAERRKAEAGTSDPADLIERLRSAAGEDGRLTLDEAVDAVTRPPARPVNPFTAEYTERQRQSSELLFGPEAEPVVPPTRPTGDADGGKGEGDGGTYEWTPGGERMRVWSEAELANSPTNEGREDE
jgi:hypothetical protein